MIDPEIRRLYLEAMKASERLVSRLESYPATLVANRPTEQAVADEIANDARFLERRFRGWYERCRDVREILEDPDYRVDPEASGHDEGTDPA